MTDLQLEICKKIYPDSMIYSICRDGVETVVPISLPRLLEVLDVLSYCYYKGEICKSSVVNCDCHTCDYCCGIGIIQRQLLNPDGTDCYLREQSEETQKKIAELLGVTF